MEGLIHVFKSQNHAVNLNNMRLNKIGCDVVIKVEDKEFFAHKIILAANLKYFESMFFKSFQESEKDNITMTGLTGTDLEAFINYAYTGEMLLSESNALDLLEVANYLGEDEVKEACIEFLKTHLTEEEACQVYKFANDIQCLSLKDIAKSKVSSRFENCSQFTEYLDLDSESLIDILSDKKDQPAKIQQILFEGIIKWIIHDAKERKIYTKSLLSTIDITKLTAEYLMSYLGKVAYRKDGCGFIEDVMFYYYASRVEKRKQEQILIVAGNINAKPNFQFYDFIEKKWSPAREIPGGVGNVNSNSVVLDDKLYYISENSRKVNLQVFDPTTKQSTMMHSSNDILGWCSMCTDNRYLYLCGGVMEDNSRSDQVLRYDLQTNSFELLPSMQTKRSSAGATFYQGCLHVVGGFDGSFKLDSVEKYDPDTMQWTYLEPLCRTRYRHTVAVLDEKLYACGRYNDNSVEFYHPVTSRWQPTFSMNHPRDEFLVIAHAGKLMAIGGDKEVTVEVYDPSKDLWQIHSEMSSGLQIKCPRGGLISGSYFVDDEN